MVKSNDIENQSSLAGTIPWAVSALKVDLFIVLTLSYSSPLHPAKVLPDQREAAKVPGIESLEPAAGLAQPLVSLRVRIIIFMWAWAALTILGSKKDPYECWLAMGGLY